MAQDRLTTWRAALARRLHGMGWAATVSTVRTPGDGGELAADDVPTATGPAAVLLRWRSPPPRGPAPVAAGRLRPSAIPAATLLFALLAAAPAAAHQAPTGWAYDWECCNTMDCGPAAGGQVREERREGVLGYAVRIPAGGHHHYPGAVDAFVPMGDPRIRVSGDEDRHACVSGSGRLLCIYVPPGGV